MNFEPFPKNPPISKIFRELGLADELGSGMRNSYKYTKMYSGGVPSFSEGDIFRIIIPLSPAATVSAGPVLREKNAVDLVMNAEECRRSMDGETSRAATASL